MCDLVKKGLQSSCNSSMEEVFASKGFEIENKLQDDVEGW